MRLPRPLFVALVACVSATSLFSAAAPRDAKKKIAKPAGGHPLPALQVDKTPIPPKTGTVYSYAEIIEPVQKAVVSIYSTKIIKERLVANPLFRRIFPDLQDQERESKLEGLGSGVIVSPDGYILTNNHVVEGADELEVALDDGRKLAAKLISTDPKTDVAVVKIDAEKLPFVTLADSDKIRVGDLVFAIGNPLGIGQTVTMGIVSAKGRSVGILGDVGGYEDFIQTDAAINMGNSGGALVDAKGRLVGVNSAILSPTRGNIGIGFAIPVNLATWIMNSLIETGSVARGYLGVQTDPVTPDVAEQLELPVDTKGVVITDIVDGTAADKAGLKRSDVVLSVNDHPISTVDEMRLLIARINPGESATLKIMRDGKPRSVEVKLDKADDKPDELFDGVNVKPLTPEDRRRLRIDPRVTGLLVTEVAESSPFREQLAPGMVIMEIGRTPLSDLPQARALVQPGRNLLAVYYPGSPPRFIVLNVPDTK